ncbi:MAG: excinuclease ABC subunit UvrA [Gammaproteobacteria bacterium]
MDKINLRGARTHNLKNINVSLPRDKLIVLTGLSGSGKSSLAFDTIYAEGQRRYVESLSAYARQFLSVMEKPDIDHIEGLSPAISIEQKSTSHNPRSTVGTITEIYDYLRLLFARVGQPMCPDHSESLEAQSIAQMVDMVLKLASDERWMLVAPIVRDRKGEHQQVFDNLARLGYVRALVDGNIISLDDPPALELRKKHNIDVIVDRFKVKPGLEQRLAESFETALELGEGFVRVCPIDRDSMSSDILFSSRFACPKCGFAIEELEPRLFSFNNPVGACLSCDGLGVAEYFDPDRVVQQPEVSLPGGAIRGWDRRNAYYSRLIDSLAQHYKFDVDSPFNELSSDIREVILRGSGTEEIEFKYIKSGGKLYKRKHPFEGVIPNMERRYKETDSNIVREELGRYLGSRKCPDCEGTRLNRAARNVFISEMNLSNLTAMSIKDASEFFNNLSLSGKRGEIAEKIVKEIGLRLSFLINVGLNYLTLDRSANTLSGGEAQRIRLASQIGAGLVGVMYVLDEPSIGLHQRDNQKLLDTLVSLRDRGNTVIVVEHDEEAIRMADYVVDIGPGAGIHGGEIVAEGTPETIASSPASLTGQYLSGARQIQVPVSRTPLDKNRVLSILGANGNNLKSVDVSVPIGLMTCITGVSGSGKSTLINDTLYRTAAKVLNRASTKPAKCNEIVGLEHFDKVVDIDQSPIGRTPRSNPATYTGLFGPIRELFAATAESRSRGYKPGRFSFNVKGGRCEACQGDGLIKVEMHFLPDVYVPCDECKGKRYNRETLGIMYKGKTISDVLDMTVEEALVFFDSVPTIRSKLKTLTEVGLSYVSIGQNATTLSGGEAQRVKLSKELSKRDTGNTLYILDEPTTGLHFYDIEQLLKVLHRLRDHGNTVVIIEHNLDVVKTADWVIDIGPEGGENGGEIVAFGTPEEVSQNESSYTGHYLAKLLKTRHAVSSMAG